MIINLLTTAFILNLQNAKPHAQITECERESKVIAKATRASGHQSKGSGLNGRVKLKGPHQRSEEHWFCLIKTRYVKRVQMLCEEIKVV